MAAETLPYQNGGVVANSNDSNSTTKKSRESERRRRRRKQKKNNKASEALRPNSAEDSDDSKENTDSNQVVEQVEIEYVPEKAELIEGMDEEFRKIFEKFSFADATALEDTDKKDGSEENAATNKKADSDSEEEENDNDQKEKGISNKKKKLQRRMKIAELKQICSRPDVVEVWDATASDPKLLVFLKSYRNTVPVPRHWCQKRKFLQGSCCGNHQSRTCRCLAMGNLESFLFYFLY